MRFARAVAHGRPKPPDASEPLTLAHTVAAMGLKYVVVTSADRDDLRDGGAQHFADCIAAIREHSPRTKIEILTSDFRGKGRMERALEILASNPPDVFNHNVETVPDLYPAEPPAASIRAFCDQKTAEAQSARQHHQHSYGNGQRNPRQLFQVDGYQRSTRRDGDSVHDRH